MYLARINVSIPGTQNRILATPGQFVYKLFFAS